MKQRQIITQSEEGFVAHCNYPALTINIRNVDAARRLFSDEKVTIYSKEKPFKRGDVIVIAEPTDINGGKITNVIRVGKQEQWNVHFKIKHRS